MTAATNTGLSIRQPWVELILRGAKTIEVRKWRTDHRGLLWLHAGKRVETEACTVYGLPPEKLVMGAIVGVVDVEDCFLFNAETWSTLRAKHRNLGPFHPRYFGWTLRNPRRIQPIPYSGRLGLMRIPDMALDGGSAHG